ncbi:hypothetical protein LJK88_06620 [Paenibacillus sp. P26]|nr:hypothetical protein LJK88_06620 [Paenibacillus sp. P26]UUZ90334.1 hypothetical protein LJK87_30915 [Paenibacillus sp. P25]
MQPINPNNIQECRPHFGKTVLVVLRDGTELIGTLSRLENEKLVLNDTPAGVATKRSRGKAAGLRQKNAGAGSPKGKKRKQTDSNVLSLAGAPFIPPGLPGAGPITLDLPMIAMVLVV